MARNLKIFFLALTLFVFSSISSECSSGDLRVISLYPGHSDNICALGGEKFLIALSENDDPELLPDLPRIPLRTGPEKIIALKPDILIMRSLTDRINPDLKNILGRTGIKIIILDPPSWNNFEEYLINLAQVLNLNPEHAINKFNSIKNNLLSKIPEHHKNFKIFVESTSREIHTCSPNSWAANLIKLVGAVNTAHDAKPLSPNSNIASFGVERVLKSLDENLDVYIIQTGAMNNTSLKDFKLRSWFKALESRNIKIYEMPEKYLSRPSLRGLEIGGEFLIKVLYGSENN